MSSKLLNASIFVLSSNFEGFSLVMAEAMECGLPLISYACPAGPKDIITDGQNGFLIPPGDEDLFAERICQLIENKEQRISMGKQARIKAQEFTIDKIIHRWQAIFENLAANE